MDVFVDCFKEGSKLLRVFERAASSPHIPENRRLDI